MADDPTPDPNDNPAPQPEPRKPEATPPWGSDEDFNPEKAWNLIQNLRSDKESLTADRDKYKQAHDEAEKAKLSDLDRATSERDEHKSRAEKAEAQLLRYEVGTAKGLTSAQAKRLVGSTKEELEADADDLLSSFGSEPRPTGDKPQERLRGGGDPDDEPDEDISKVVADIPRI